VPRAVQVGVDHRVPSLDGVAFGALGKLPAGVVHEHVDPAMAGEHELDELLDLLRATDVAYPRQWRHARRRADRRGSLREMLLLPAPDHDLRAGPDERDPGP